MQGESLRKVLMKNQNIRTLLILMRGKPVEEVLLGYKKRGYGVGKYTGFGGKVEADETILQGAIREMEEETSIQVNEQDLNPVGQINFVFPNKPEWTQLVHVFTASRWKGDAVETSEMRPAWYRIADIPYDEMWEDGRFWLPPLLEGDGVRMQFTFNEDNETIADVYVEEFPPPAD